MGGPLHRGQRPVRVQVRFPRRRQRHSLGLGVHLRRRRRVVLRPRARARHRPPRPAWPPVLRRRRARRRGTRRGDVAIRSGGDPRHAGTRHRRVARSLARRRISLCLHDAALFVSGVVPDRAAVSDRRRRGLDPDRGVHRLRGAVPSRRRRRTRSARGWRWRCCSPRRCSSTRWRHAASCSPTRRWSSRSCGRSEHAGSSVSRNAAAIAAGVALSSRGIVGLVYAVFYPGAFAASPRRASPRPSSPPPRSPRPCSHFLIWDAPRFLRQGPFAIQLSYAPPWLVGGLGVAGVVLGATSPSARRTWLAIASLLYAAIASVFVYSIVTEGWTTVLLGDTFDISYFAFGQTVLLFCVARFLVSPTAGR